MSRADYSDDLDHWAMIRWRGAVNSAIKGKRGQAFLRELLTALDSLPEPKLIAHELERDGDVCALGSVGRARGMNMAELDPYDHCSLKDSFGVAEALIREIEFVNDNDFDWRNEPPEERFRRVRAWVIEQLGS